MGEVIQLKFARDVEVKRFTLAVEQDGEGQWSIGIHDFHGHGRTQADICREIAQLLPTMIGGLYDIADKLQPSERGTIVGMITIYTNGTIDMLMETIDNRQKQTWMTVAVDKVRAYIDKVYQPSSGRA